jgi:hypothetical protein
MRLDRLPARAEGGFHVVVESPRGSTLELDPELGCIVVGRPLPQNPKVLGWKGPQAAEVLIGR